MFDEKATTMNDIKYFATQALTRSSGTVDHRVFLIQDKKVLINMVKSSRRSVLCVAKQLATVSDTECKWRNRISEWVKAERAGRLNVEQAVAVQRTKPSTGYKLNPMHETIAEMVKNGRTLADIESCFAIAFDRVKDDVKKAALASVEVILKARGLTLDDIKAMV